MTFADITIVTCSHKDEKFDSLQKNLKRIFGDDVHIVRIPDAKSMAEGYNRGMAMAKREIVAFCHDDIEFVNYDAPNIIKEDMANYDIVGVAGTSRLWEGRWHTAEKRHVHGQVSHTTDSHRNDYQLCIYGERPDVPVVEGIQALDGLFFAVRNNVLEYIRFDEIFNGFHLYDLDFTYSAYLKGFRIAVDYRIHLLHHSGGNYDHVWKKYFDLFNKKYANILADKESDGPHTIRRMVTSSKQSLDSLMSGNLRPGQGLVI